MRSVRSMLRALLLGLFVVLFWFLLPNLLYLGGVLLFPDRAEGLLSFLSFFGTALSALLLMGIFALFGKRFRETVCWCPKRAPVGVHLSAVLFGVCANTAVSTLLALLPLPESLLNDYAQQSQSVYDPTHGVLSLLSAVILAPLFEEILFRGYLFRFLRSGFPFWAAAAVTALLFGLAHGQILWICYAGVMGLLFCFLTERKGTLTVAVAAHFGFNLTAVPELLFPDRQTPVALLAAVGVLCLMLAVLLWIGVLRKRG